MNHLHVKMWTHIVLIWGVFIWNLAIYSKTKYHKLATIQTQFVFWKSQN